MTARKGVRKAEELTAVILAGGHGRRLLPYTTSFPKPLMPVGDRPILEILVRQLARAGFTRLIFAVGHLAELIEAFFGNGSKWGVRIEYAREDQPLGTAAPLKAMIERLPETFLVTNGDILCDLDFRDFHNAHQWDDPPRLLTISTCRRELRSEYGVLECAANGIVQHYSEKPVFPLYVSQGIYAFSREALDWIPENRRMDFPDLVQSLIRNGQSVVAREHSGLWLDIGRPEDYERAQQLVADNPHIVSGIDRMDQEVALERPVLRNESASVRETTS